MRGAVHYGSVTTIWGIPSSQGMSANKRHCEDVMKHARHQYSSRTPRHIAVGAGMVVVVAALALVSAAPAAFSAPRYGERRLLPPNRGPADLGVWVARDQTGVALGTREGLAPAGVHQLESSRLHPVRLPWRFRAHQQRQAAGPRRASRSRRQGGDRRPACSFPAPPGTRCWNTATWSPATARLQLYRRRYLLVYAPHPARGQHRLFWSLPACTAPGQKNFLSIRVIAPGIGVARSNG